MIEIFNPFSCHLSLNNLLSFSCPILLSAVNLHQFSFAKGMKLSFGTRSKEKETNR